MSDEQPRPAILVVDDALPNVKLLRLILGDAGYRVLEAFSGPQALEMLHRERPDAMLLDVRMPGMTGYEVCRRVRADPQFAALPVIMVTALSLSEERILGIEAGATDFISKPFNKKELLARVRASLMLAKYGGNGIVPQLPGAVLIVDPGWRILAASPQSIALLGIPPAATMQFDLTQLLDAATRTRLAAGEAPANFRLQARTTLSAQQLAVQDADGQLLLRLLTLHNTPE